MSMELSINNQQINLVVANSGANTIAVGDFNHDNHSAIVVSNWESDNIVIFYDNGNRTFGDEVLYSTRI